MTQVLCRVDPPHALCRGAEAFGFFQRLQGIRTHHHKKALILSYYYGKQDIFTLKEGESSWRSGRAHV